MNPNHPPICMYGYGDHEAYKKSKFKVVLCGINGTWDDVVFVERDNVEVEIFKWCVVGVEEPTLAGVAYIISKAAQYFTGDRQATYFTWIKKILATLDVGFHDTTNIAIYCDCFSDFATNGWNSSLGARFLKHAY